jgi:single-strand DNA-binding protein
MSSAAGGGAAASRDRGGDGTTDRTAPRNEVLLVGRVPAAPEERELPSGDVLVTWRVVVGRPPGRRPPEGVRATTVDTLDCVAWTASARRAASALVPDDVVEVSGALRRRFWRAGAGAASRCEVEVSTVRRVRRRPPSKAAGPPD